jgi:hypothetical protein
MKSHLVGLICLAASVTSGAIAGNLPELKISQITANPSQYIGKKVVVLGFVALGDQEEIFRGHAIFESKAVYDQENRLYHSGRYFDPRPFLKYCLTIANPERYYADAAQFNGKTIRIAGTIRPDEDVAPCGSGWALEID